jgi:hypothetical protein
MIPSFPRIVKATHRTYNHKEIDDVLAFLSQPVITRGALTRAAELTGIPQTTLASWRRIRLQPGREGWFPGASGRPNRRILPEQTERAIHDHLHTNFIESGFGATRATLKTLALNAFSSQEPEDMHTDRFAASGSFLTRFQERWQLSLRTPHRERRTATDADSTDYFLRRLNALYDEYAHNRILNMDETSWKLYAAPRKVLAEKGSNTLKLKSSRSEKESFTALGAIKADGTKLPLWVIAKGRTEKCEQKYGEHEGTIVNHSPNGWATEPLIIEYLNWIDLDAVDGEPCVLVLDIDPMHRTPAVQASARDLDVELLDVPAGATEEFQPLDRRIFGELKSRARVEFERIRASTGSIAMIVGIASRYSMPGKHGRSAKASVCPRYRKNEMGIMTSKR